MISHNKIKYIHNDIEVMVIIEIVRGYFILFFKYQVYSKNVFLDFQKQRLMKIKVDLLLDNEIDSQLLCRVGHIEKS